MTQSAPIDAGTRGRSIRLDLVVAIALALILTIGWTLTDWPRLSRMLLPDPDDMMRLAQVRDWLAGQGTNDWTQYRMGPPNGTPMHWSRINDMGIAALILLARPFAGQADAELIAVLVYPALLFACALFLSARIARRLWGPSAGPVAAVLTALAYPGTTVFIPGRIDHHALQVVLIQLLVLLLMRAPRYRDGIIAGATTAISLVVGLETAPQVAAFIAVMAMLWAVRGMEERARLAGFAAGLGAAMLFFLAFLRPTYWPPELCDAFTPASSTAALAVAAALAILAAAAGRLPGWRSRIGAGAILAIIVIGAILIAFPSCINGPYGAMDPFLRRAFIPFIDEANGIFAQPRLSRIIAIGGVLTAACLAAGWMLLRERRRWSVALPIVAVVAVSAVVMLFQVRGAYIGAPLSAPILAGVVVVSRQLTTGQLPTVVVAWLVGAGIAYSTLPAQIERFTARPGAADINRPANQVVCSVGDTWDQIDRYPPGVVMAGTSVAAYLIGATHHSTIGAGYHRNNAGNMAMYLFFLSTPDRAHEIAREWKVDYVIFCPGDFAEIDVTRNFRGSAAARLQRGEALPWLEPLALHNTPLRLYKLR
jgi:hypothetical protein